MGLPPPRARSPRAALTARSVLALALATAVLAGCGGVRVDSGGFTTADRSAAQMALDVLRPSNIPLQLVNLTLVAGSIPVCRLHLQSRSPSTFRVYLFWTPYNRLHTYTWLTMTLGPEASRDRFHLGTAPGMANAAGAAVVTSPTAEQRRLDREVLIAHAGNVFAKPAARCQLLMNGYLRLLPAT